MEEEKVFEMPSGFQKAENEAGVKTEGQPQDQLEGRSLIETTTADTAVAPVKKKTRQTAPQITEEQMYQIIRDYKASGMTRRAFCLERGYPMSNFYYWQKKYYQKFPEELAEKPKRGKPGRPAKKGAKATTTRKIKATKAKKTTQAAETIAEPVAVVPEPVATTPKRKGRPPKKATEAALPEAPAKAKAAPKAKATRKTTASKAQAVSQGETVSADTAVPSFKGVYMQIKYPNGIRLNIPADMELKRLKELLDL